MSASTNQIVRYDPDAHFTDQELDRIADIAIWLQELSNSDRLVQQAILRVAAAIAAASAQQTDLTLPQVAGRMAGLIERAYQIIIQEDAL